MLGPRIISLDYTIRQSDPTYVLGGPITEKLRDQTGQNALLSILYSDTIMCVKEALSQTAPTEIFRRGASRPLVAGASAKVILAYLPPHQLRRVFAKHSKEIAAKGLGSDWEKFKMALRDIRSAGYSVSVGEHNPGIVSISSAVFNRYNEVMGSITLAGVTSQVSEDDFREFIPHVIEAGQEISARISRETRNLALPARAVG